MEQVKKQLSVLLADTYALYLKTQNYHWHVTGLQFSSLHALFESHYQELAVAVDDIAERLRMLDEVAPATFTEFNQLKTLSDGQSSFSASEMLDDLHTDHQQVLKLLLELTSLAAECNDEGTVALLSERISHHEKAAWMLAASR